MSLPEMRGAGQALTEPKTGETKSGGTWCSVLLKFASWRKVDDTWTEGDSTVASVIAFDDVAQVLSGYRKGDSIAVQGTVSASVWKDKAQLRVVASKVWTPERRAKGAQNARTPDQAVGSSPTQDRGSRNRGDIPTVDQQWPRPALISSEGRPRGAQRQQSPADLDAYRREAGERLIRQHRGNAQRAGRLL